MLVYVNGERWPEQGASPAVVLKEVADWARSREAVVTEIKVDGTEYTGSLDMLGVEEVGEIRLTTLPVSQLILETKASVKNYLPGLQEAVRQAAYLLQSGQEGKAFPLCVSIVDGLDWLSQAVELLTALDPSYMPGDEVAALRDRIKDLFAAWDSADYVLVGDLLEYELAPLLDRWQAVVDGGAE